VSADVTTMKTAAEAELALRDAGIDPGLRGEALSVEQFARIAAARPSG